VAHNKLTRLRKAQALLEQAWALLEVTDLTQDGFSQLGTGVIAVVAAVKRAERKPPPKRKRK